MQSLQQILRPDSLMVERSQKGQSGRPSSAHSPCLTQYVTYPFHPSFSLILLLKVP